MLKTATQDIKTDDKKRFAFHHQKCRQNGK